ncbi:MAG TPA: GNAT family N-acetyltransferase [Clostridia bacterium]
MINTKRLEFRKYTMEDLDFLVSMTSDPDVMKYIGNGIPWTLEETKQRLEKFIGCYGLGEGMGLMLLINKQDGIPIGHAGLVPQIVEGKSETEIGYWISQNYWGQGYASEAAAACRDFGFQTLNKERLVSIIQFENTGSKNVAKKTGMTFEREVDFNSKNVALYSIDRKREKNKGC